MGTQTVNPEGYARALAVARMATRIRAAAGDWRKYGEDADSILADAIGLALGQDFRPTTITNRTTGEPPNQCL